MSETRNKSKLILVCAAVLSAALISGSIADAKPAPVPALPAADKQHVLSDRFVLVRTVRQIPAVVRRRMLGKHEARGMADPGQRYGNGDVGPQRNPGSGLVFAALSPGYCLVYSQFAGFYRGTGVALYRLLPGHALFVWSAEMTQGAGTLSLTQLQSAIRRGRYHAYPPVDFGPYRR